MNEIRIGKVSFVNYTAGTVRVVYPDRSDKSTAELPVFCGFGKEYQMPDVGDLVLVVHLSNDSSMGEYSIDVIMIAKYLERIGDHATNIAEWVEYSITGQRSKNN